MSLAVVVLVGAVLVGRLLGGSITCLTHVSLRRKALVVGAVLAQAGGAIVGVLGVADERTAYTTGLAISAALALAFCVGNARVHGVALMSLGLTANALVVGINGAMPVSIVAAYHARVPITAIAAGTDSRHEIAGTGTSLRWLGDVVPVPLPVRPEVISPGDVLVVAGLAELVVVGMRWRRREEES